MSKNDEVTSVSQEERTELGRLQAAMETWGIGTYDHDHLTGEIEASLRMRQLYGLDAKAPVSVEVFGRAVFPADMPSAMSAVAKAHDPAGNGEFDLLHRIRRQDGAVRWIHSRSKTVFREVHGVRVAARTRGSILDVTSSKRAEEELSQRSAILEATPDFVCITDADANLLYLNRSGREFMGIAPDASLEGRSMVEAHTEATTERIQSVGIPIAIEKGSWKNESEFLDREGKIVPMSQMILAHLDKEGEVTHFSAIARDLSREKQLESQFRQAQKMEAIGQLAGGVAHDFNNLLSVILGFAEFGMEEVPDEHPARESFKEIERAAIRAGSLTQQLLAFSRKQILKPQVIEVNELLRRTAPMLNRVITENIEISVSPSDARLKIKADPNQIEQILLNLIVNARDALPTGGKILIESFRSTIEEREVSARFGLAPGVYVVIAVTDNGHGMDAETRERIFDPFFTTKEQGKGTGLGLSTVFGIVRQSGGGIWVYSEPGNGTTFKIYFPCSDEIPVRTVPPRRSSIRVHDATLLVTEDDAQLLKMVTRALGGAGYKVLSASDPREALRIAEEHDGEIQLLITDVVMPKMTGKELAREINKSRPATQVLYMSGYTENSIVHHGVLDEDIQFLPKPVAAQQLIRKVEEVLELAAISDG